MRTTFEILGFLFHVRASSSVWPVVGAGEKTQPSGFSGLFRKRATHPILDMDLTSRKRINLQTWAGI
jgi:hypothetical protein